MSKGQTIRREWLAARLQEGGLRHGEKRSFYEVTFRVQRSEAHAMDGHSGIDATQNHLMHMLSAAFPEEMPPEVKVVGADTTHVNITVEISEKAGKSLQAVQTRQQGKGVVAAR